MFNVSLTQNCIKNQVNVGLIPVLFPHFALSSVLRVAVPVIEADCEGTDGLDTEPGAGAVASGKKSPVVFFAVARSIVSFRLSAGASSDLSSGQRKRAFGLAGSPR